jgi:capsular exopolysaccharide synthesis family protein
MDIDRFLQTQMEVLESRAVANDVDRMLGLSRNGDFLKVMGVRGDVDPAKHQTVEEARKHAVQVILGDKLTVGRPKVSRIASVMFTSPDPQLSKRVANAFAAAFINSNLKRKVDQTAYARGFLQQQLVGAKQRLEDSERSMIHYARAAGLIDTSTGAGSSGSAPPQNGSRSLVTSDLVALNTAYANAQAARVAAEQRWNQAQATPLLSLPEVVSNPAITQLSNSRAAVEANYSQERQKHRLDFPAVQQIGAQLVSMDRQITQVASAIRQSIGDQYRTAARQETALRGEVETLKLSALSEQDRSVQYNILKRETDTNRTMYDALLQRYKELSAQVGASASNISVIDAAEAPLEPISPRPVINILLGLVAGFVIAMVTIFIKEYIDDTVRGPEDVSEKLGLLLLNSIPHVELDEPLTTVIANPSSLIAESYAALRISIELVDSHGLPNSLLFTSATAGEGKSTSAYAVARDFAQSGKRTVILDADLRRPSLHRILQTKNKQGLSSVLAQQMDLDSVLLKTDSPNLDFIPSGPHPPNPTELLSGQSFKLMLDALKHRYDLVVIDSPPLLGLADALILGDLVGGIVFIVEANSTRHGHTKGAIRRLTAARAPIMGAVLTKYDARAVGYSYKEYLYQNYEYRAES